MSHAVIDTPVGPIRLVATAAGLTHVVYPDRDHGRPAGDGSVQAADIVADATQQLAEYFAGQRQTFDLPLALSGTEFQREVWLALAQIPFGETTSYGDLAARLGRPGAARAVGAANGANPVSIILPCHRVVGANGRLTGYAGGLVAKQTLLKLERRHTASRRSCPAKWSGSSAPATTPRHPDPAENPPPRSTTGSAPRPYIARKEN